MRQPSTESHLLSGILTALAIAFAVFLISHGGSITGLTIVQGNASGVNSSSSGLSQFVVYVNESTGLSQNFTGNLTVRFVDNITGFPENMSTFVLNFDNTTLNLTPVIIDKQTGALAIRNLSLFGSNKTIFLERQSLYVCVRDTGNASLSGLTSNCTGPNELVIKCNNTIQSGYRCSVHGDLSTELRIFNLSHSAVRSLPFILSPSKLGQGANFTVNITGQDFGNVTNVSIDYGDVIVHNVTFVNSTFINMTVAVRFNATTNTYNITLRNNSGVYRVHDDAFRIVQALNITAGTIRPLPVEINNQTRMNITFAAGTGVNISTLNLTVDNLTFTGPSNTVIVLNTSNINISIVNPYVLTFVVALPLEGTYNVTVDGRLNQSSPHCTGTCTQNIVRRQLDAVAVAMIDETISFTHTFTSGNPTASITQGEPTGAGSVVVTLQLTAASCNAAVTFRYTPPGVSACTGSFQLTPGGGDTGCDSTGSKQGTITGCSASDTGTGSLTATFSGTGSLEAGSGSTVQTPSRGAAGSITGSGARGVPWSCMANTLTGEMGVKSYVLGFEKWIPCSSDLWAQFADGGNVIADYLSEGNDACCVPRCDVEYSCLPCHGGPVGQQGVCVHIKHPHEYCPRNHVAYYCGQPIRDVPTGIPNIIEDVNEQMKECCPGVQVPAAEVPPLKKPCQLEPYSEVTVVCKDPPAELVKTLTTYEVIDPPCVYNAVQATLAKIPCADPDKPKNECWAKGKKFCKNNACATEEPQCAPTSDQPCCDYGPNSLAPNACAMTHIGGGTLFTYDGRCRKCKLNCDLLCVDLPGMSLFLSMGLIGPPSLPNLIECFEEKQRFSPTSYWTPLYPPEDPLTPPPAPKPVPPPVPVPPPPGSDFPDPTTIVKVDRPPKLTTPTPAPAPAPEPQTLVTVPPELQVQFPCITTGGDPGSASITSTPREAFTVPAPYEYITSFGCSGSDIKAGATISDNWGEVRAWRIRSGEASSLGIQPTFESTCGGISSRDIRSDQIGSAAPSELQVADITPLIEQQRIMTSAEADRTLQATSSTGEITVELLQAPSTATNVRVYNVQESVPTAENPALRIFGTPFWLSITPFYSGPVRITGRLTVPDFIDRSSVGLYVRLGTTWRYLDTIIEPDGSFTAVIDDISVYLTDGKALFAWMGVIGPTVTKLELVYEGGSRSPRRAIVLVHGFTMDATRWQVFIDDFVRTRAPFQIWVFSYPLSLATQDAAEAFAAQLETEVAPRADEVYFLAHSMGGIISQIAVKDASEKGYSIAGKARRMILAGQPGLGSPSLEVYGRLFAALMNLRSAAAVFSQRSPMLGDAVRGIQVKRNDGTEYYAIVGTQTYPFTKELFVINSVYQTNDGVLTDKSGATVGGIEITDECKHLFKVPVTHTDLLWAWLSRMVAERIVTDDLAQQDPDAIVPGHLQHFSVGAGDCEPGDIIVLGGKRIPEAKTYAPGLCNCGNGVCGIDENALNCPGDCASEYRFYYLCRILPWFWFPIIFILLIVSAVYTVRAIKRHERGKGAGVLFFIALVLLGILLSQHNICQVPPLLGYLLLSFIAAMLLFTLLHLEMHKGATDKIDDTSARELERLLERARGR